MFINWGVYAVPSCTSEWFWKGQPQPNVVEFMKKFYPPNWSYADFAKLFRAKFYDPNMWKDIIVSSGGPLKKALKGTDVRFGVYHAMIEWFYPIWLTDQGKTTLEVHKRLPWYQTGLRISPVVHVYEIINTYQPEVLWNDAAWLAPSWCWNSTIFLAWLYNKSPGKENIVTNDRWGYDCYCKHGGIWTCSDRFHPGHVMPHKWVNAMTVDRGSWGFRRNADLSQYYSIEELLEEVIYTISFGGNILINVGPTFWGTISPIYEERFRQLRPWLKVIGEAIYKTTPWTHQNDTVTNRAWYTASKADKNTIYCMVLDWPSDNEIILGALKDTTVSNITLLGTDAPMNFTPGSSGLKVVFPALNI